MSDLAVLSPELQKFAQYLQTYYAPSKEEIRTISKLLEEPRSKLETLELEITKLQNELDKKRKEHDAVNSQVEKYRALITSPIRHIPADILSEIFVRCLSKDHASPMHETFAPMLLLTVCGNWRETALSTPQLWSSIHIPIPNARPGYHLLHVPQVDDYRKKAIEAVKQRAMAVDLWLSRSGACPLEISLFCNGILDTDHGKDIFNVVRKYSTRWKKLKFACPAECFTAFASLAPSDVPLLEVLNIQGDHRERSGDRRLAWKDCGIFQAPRLHRVSLRQLNDDPTSLPLRWTHLTSLTLLKLNQTHAQPTTLSLFNILKECHKLVSCKIELPHTEPVSIPESHDPIFLPLLQNLALIEGGSDITQLLSRLMLPSLQSFEFLGGSGWSNALSSKLTPFLSRMSRTLRKFTTDANTFAGNEFIDCLQACTRLTSLTLQRSPAYITPNRANLLANVNDHLLTCFTTSNEQGAYLCPLLETLECHDPPHFTDAGLYQFISRKQSGGTPGLSKVKRIAIWFDRLEKNPRTEELETFIKQGLSYDVTYTTPPPIRDQLSTLDGLPYRIGFGPAQFQF